MAHLGNTVVNGALRVLGGEYVDTINGVTVGSSPKFTDTTYSAGSNITQSGTQFSLTKTNVTNALGYTPPTTNTTYTGANGVSLSGTTFSNSGVRAVATGGSNGTINVNTNGSTANVAVKGLGAMAYKASVSKSDVGLGNVANLDQSKAIKSITRSGTTFTATAIDGTTSSFTQQDNNTTYANVSTSAAGLAPKVTSTSAFLKGDGTLATPTNTTYSNVSTSAAGLAPKVTDTSKYLKGDGTWATPTNTTYSNVSSASAGLAPKGAAVSSQSQNTKFLREDGSWAKPSYTTNTNTTYTFANGTNGFTVTPSGGSAQTVTVTPSVTKSGVGLGNVANLDQSKAIKSITRSGTTFTATALDGTTSSFTQQDNNTTYANVSTSAAGLAPKVTSTSAFLKGDGTWATPTNTTYSNVSTSAAGLAPKVTSTSKFLKGDGTWATPTNTWTAMVGATSAANGSVGYVNAVPPKIGYNSKFLRADGTWQEPGTYQADNTTGLNDYDVLFSGRKTGSGNYYSSTNKSSNFKYNPSEGNLTVAKINGTALGAAAYKGVDTTVTSGSNNLVTSGAVFTAIENAEGLVWYNAVHPNSSVNIQLDMAGGIHLYKIITFYDNDVYFSISYANWHYTNDYFVKIVYQANSSALSITGMHGGGIITLTNNTDFQYFARVYKII